MRPPRHYHPPRKRCSLKTSCVKSARWRPVILTNPCVSDKTFVSKVKENHVQDRKEFWETVANNTCVLPLPDPILQIPTDILNVVRILNVRLTIHCHVYAVLTHVLHFKWLHRISHLPPENYRWSWTGNCTWKFDANSDSKHVGTETLQQL